MKEAQGLKIAMIGCKGIPAIFGGIEKHVEEISVRLARDGHDVTVYGRKPFSEDCSFRGVKVRNIPSIRTKNLDAATNSFLATAHAIFGNYDIIHYHGIGPSIFCPFARMSGKKVVSTIHAPDYRQVKWGRFASFMLTRGEKIAATVPHSSIAVSRLMSRRLRDELGSKVRYIPNGANIIDVKDFSVGEDFGIQSGEYILAVGRFIREKGFHDLAEAFSGIETDMKLVLVGDVSAADRDYRELVFEKSNQKTVFTGFQAGDTLNQLYSNCAFYVLPSYVEGLPITLIEAMSASAPLLISDIPENVEVAGEVAEKFRCGDVEDLRNGLIRMLSMSGGKRSGMGERGRGIAAAEYNWDRITEELEKIYIGLKNVL